MNGAQKVATNTEAAKKMIRKRNSVRYPGDPAAVAYIDTGRNKNKSNFKHNYIGIVSEESYRGCGLIMILDESLITGDQCQVKIGNGPILKAEVRWRMELDAKVMRIGLMYVD